MILSKNVSSISFMITLYIYWNSEFDKNYMMSNVLFHYDVISDIKTELLQTSWN